MRKFLKWREPTKAQCKTTTLNSPIIRRFANNIRLGTKNPQVGQLCALSPIQRKRIPQIFLRGSTLPAASTPLQGEAEYPVFNWQLSQRPLCLQLPSPCSNRHNVFNCLPKMGFGDALTQHSSKPMFTTCANYLGVGMEFKHMVSAFP